MKSSLFVNTLLTLFYYFQCTIGVSPSDDQSELSGSIKDRLIVSNGENVIDEYVQYKTPQFPQEDVHLYESFDDVHRFKKIWHKSESTKGPKGEFNYDGTWDIVVTHQKIRGDYGLRMRSKSKHHAISRRLDQEFNFTGSPLIIQYDVQFRNGQECGGAYIKLLSAPSGNLSLINDQSKYSIMFGPDKCGSDHRLHFIFSHINSQTGKIREIHWKDAHTLTNLADVFIDGKWHLFRLNINPSNRFEISMDKRIVAIGSLLTDFSPSVNPELEIDDPDDTKPEDWDERGKIPDPDAVKPDDWDNGEPKLIPDTKARKPKGWLENEPLTIPDPNAVKPEDWSDNDDGTWKPPMIKNPRCASAPGCGPWSPPMIDNPKYKGEWMPPLIPNLAYQGKWVPRKIPNPDYFEDKHPYKSIAPIDAVTFELWTLSDGIVFDNILITSDITIADSIAMASYQIKKEINDLETDNWFKRMIKQTNKKPWLWAVYIVATAIPVIFFIGFCCVTPGSSSSESSASSTNYSSATLSSIFELPNPSTSSTSATLIDNLHPNHLLTESCKIDHTDQYAFRYHDACINDSGCSTENLESTGLRSRFTSSSRHENNSGYSSSYNVQHSHSSATQHSTNILASSFKFNSCLEEIIPDEEEEEQDYLKETEMHQFEENEFNLMEGELNYDENIIQLESDDLCNFMEEEKVNGDKETCNSDVTVELCNLYEPSIDNLINGTEEVSQEENGPEDVDDNYHLTDDIQVNDVMLNSSDNDNTYDNNDSALVENELNEDPVTQDSMTSIITGDFTNDNIDVNIGDGGETNVNGSTDNFHSQNAIMLENSSVRRRRKGKGRRKDTAGSRKNGDDGLNETKGSTRQGNNKSKNRRTKARRE